MPATDKVVPLHQGSFSGKLPRKPKNDAVRPREFLTENEVEQLITAAKSIGRHGHRDATMILMAYSHGFRVSELINLKWSQLDLDDGTVAVKRLKNGKDTHHPLRGREIRSLRRLKREYPVSPFVFTTERKGPLTASTVRKLIARAGKNAELPFPVHPHMLRHSCGYKLANDGQDTRAIQHYLGHKNIQHTVTYTELSPNRFNHFFRD